MKIDSKERREGRIVDQRIHEKDEMLKGRMTKTFDFLVHIWVYVWSLYVFAHV